MSDLYNRAFGGGGSLYDRAFGQEQEEDRIPLYERAFGRRQSDAAAGLPADELFRPEAQSAFERLLVQPGKRALLRTPRTLLNAANYLTQILPGHDLRTYERNREGIERLTGGLEEIAGAIDVERGRSLIERGVQAAVESSPQLAATVASGPGAMTTAFGLAGSQSEEEARSRGLSPKAASFKGALSGALTAPLEAIGAGSIGRLLRKVPAAQRRELLQRILAEPATEFGQEGIELLLEKLTGKDFAEGEISERLSVAPIAGAVSSGVAGGAGLGYRRLERAVTEPPSRQSQAGAIDLGSIQQDADVFKSRFARLMTTRRGLPEPVFRAMEQSGRDVEADVYRAQNIADRFRRTKTDLARSTQNPEEALGIFEEQFHRYVVEPEFRALADREAMPRELQELAQEARGYIDEMTQRLLDTPGLLTDAQRATLEGVRELDLGAAPALSSEAHNISLRAYPTPARLDPGLPAPELQISDQLPGLQFHPSFRPDDPIDLVTGDSPALRTASREPALRTSPVPQVQPRTVLPPPSPPELTIEDSRPMVRASSVEQRGLGQYLRRSYAFQDDAKAQFISLGGQVRGSIWTMPKAGDIWQGGREWMSEQPDVQKAIEGLSPREREVFIDNRLIDLFRQADVERPNGIQGPVSAADLGVLGTIDRSSLKHRNDLDVRFRKLLGEYRGEMAFLKTIESMSRGLSKGKLYTGLLESGMGRLFLEKPPEELAAGTFVSLQSRAGSSVAANEILGIFAGREPLAPRAPGAPGRRRVPKRADVDLFVQAPLLDALDQGLAQGNWLKVAAQHYIAAKPIWMAAKLSGLAKASLTVYLPRTQLRNFWSNSMALMAGGNLFRPREAAGAFRRALKVGFAKAAVGTRAGGKVDRETAARVEAGIRGGHLATNVDVKDVEYYLNDTFERFGNGTERVAQKLEGGTVGDTLAALVRGGKKVAGSFPRAYELGDNIPKRAAFYQELAQLQEIFPNADPNALIEEANEIVRQTMQNYNRLAVLVQEWRAFPLIGPFVSFPVSSMINLKNQVKRSFQEIGALPPDEMSVLKSGAWKNAASDPESRAQVARGLRRLGGTVSAVSVGPAALGTLFKGLSLALSPMLDLEPGEDDENGERDRRQTLPPWSRFNRTMFLGSSASEAGVEYALDVTFLDYFGTVTKPIFAAIRSGEFDESAWSAALKELAAPYLDADVFFGAVGEVVWNQDQYGRKIFNENSPWYKSARDRATHLFLGAVGPADALWRLGHGIADVPDSRGREYDAWTELFAQAAGPRIMRIDYGRSIRHKANHAQSILEGIHADIRDDLIVPQAVPAEDAERIARFHLQAVTQVLREAQEMHSISQRHGISAERAAETLEDSRLPKFLSRPLLGGADPEDLAKHWLRTRYELVQKHRNTRLGEAVKRYRDRRIPKGATPEDLRQETERLRNLWQPLDLSFFSDF